MKNSNLLKYIKKVAFIFLIFSGSNSFAQIELSDKFLKNYRDFFPHYTLSHFNHIDTIIFIYPDIIEDSLMMELNTYVNKLANPSVVLTGKEAIENKLVKSNELIVFGDATINEWCKHYINDLPINKDLLKGRTSISCWLNPINPLKGCLLYSFSPDKHIPKFDGNEIGQQVAIKEDTTVLFQGYYNLRNKSLVLSKRKDELLSESKKFEKVKDLNLYLISSCDEMEQIDNEIDEAEQLIPDDINRNFNNVNDLDWLDQIAESNEVICIGENHYFKTNINLRNRIFFYLNQIDNFSYLLMEKPYSLTPIIDHFLTLTGNDSALFHEAYIEKVVHSEEDFELMKHIKHWNRAHTSKPVKIGFTDIEHQYIETVNSILLPLLYETTNDSIFSEDAQINNLEQLDSFVTEAEELMGVTQFEKIGFIRKKDFISTLNSLKQTSIAYKLLFNRDGKGFNRVRNRTYIDNVLSFRQEGKPKDLNKLLVFGGSTHFTKNTRDSLNVHYYLNKLNPGTKEKVYSIRLLSLGYSFENLNLNSEHINSMGRNYKRHIINAKAYFNQNNESIWFSIFPNKVSFLLDMISLGCKLNYNPYLFDPKFWKLKLKEYENIGRKDYLSSYDLYLELSSFNKSIIIPRSFLINAIE